MDIDKKSREELISEVIALRQRISDLERGEVCKDDVEYKRSTSNADFYLTILDEAPALIWRAATNAKCDWFNATWLAFTGRKLSEEIGDGWAEGVHPEDFDRCLKTYLDAFKLRKFFQMEYRLRRHDGEYRWILDIGCPFKDSGGDFAGYIGYCFDVTERKTNEMFRSEVERIVRHDIKTPLIGIHSLAQIALEDSVGDDLKPYVPALLRGVRHVISLVESGDKIASLERGDYKPDFEVFDFGVLVNDIVFTLKQSATDKLIEIDVSQSEAREGSASKCHGEELLIYNMMSNILRNAIEASPPGKEVKVKYGLRNGKFEVSVHNFGPIPASIRDKFFDKYVTSGKPHGTGLGTYVCKMIASAHGGTIAFSTSKDEGTEIFVSLPVLC